MSKIITISEKVLNNGKLLLKYKLVNTIENYKIIKDGIKNSH